MISKIDKYKKFKDFAFPKEDELHFKIPKKYLSYTDLYNICNCCAKGVPVDISFKMNGKDFAFKVGKEDAKYFQEDDWANLLDFCFLFYYQSIGQIFMNMNTLAKSQGANATQAAKLLFEYEKALRDSDEIKRRQLL